MSEFLNKWEQTKKHFQVTGEPVTGKG